MSLSTTSITQDTTGFQSDPNLFTPKRIFNSLLLLLCFGLASYTIFNVDHGMTRGWTVAEQAMRIPLDNWASYESSLNTQPVVTKTMINVIIYLLGDWLSQTIFVKNNMVDFDAMRTFRNGFIGLCFGPLVHLYYEFSDTILPVEIGINRLYKICMDQTIYLAVKCSIYIIAVNILAGESFETATDKVKDKLQGIMFTAWRFWPLVHLVTYNVIPARHRILWVNCVDLIWNAILALRTNSKTEDTSRTKESLIRSPVVKWEEEPSLGDTMSLAMDVLPPIPIHPIQELKTLPLRPSSSSSSSSVSMTSTHDSPISNQSHENMTSRVDVMFGKNDSESSRSMTFSNELELTMTTSSSSSSSSSTYLPKEEEEDSQSQLRYK